MDKELFWDNFCVLNREFVYSQTVPVDIHTVIHS